MAAIDFNAWLGGGVTPISAAQRAVDAWHRIQRNPTSVTFTKPRVVAANGTVTPAAALAAQTVRIEPDNRESSVEGVAGLAPVRKAIVYGVINHPTVTDTNMAEGYIFSYQGDRYRCVEVKAVPSGAPGELQGVFVVNG